MVAVFHQMETGKELLKLLRHSLSDIGAIPTHPSYIAQFGSGEAYLAWREGQRSVITLIDRTIERGLKNFATSEIK